MTRNERNQYRTARRAYAEVRHQMATEAAPAEPRGIGWVAWVGMAAAVIAAAMNYLSGLAI